MERSRWDVVGGSALLLVAAGLVVQLLVADATGGFQVTARVLRLVIVLAFAAVFLTRRDLAAFAVAVVAVGVLLVVGTVGLLVAPDQFVGTGPKAPESPEQARAVGLLLTVGLAVVGSLVVRRWWRFRRGSGVDEPGEDGAHGG
ncbi:MAG TPA: hypothetical protein VD864_18115 [Nocardioides sp.]|nr:hypothetical protein [Nocardioides sp.]